MTKNRIILGMLSNVGLVDASLSWDGSDPHTCPSFEINLQDQIEIFGISQRKKEEKKGTSLQLKR
jgi:hypothetical protein